MDWKELLTSPLTALAVVLSAIGTAIGTVGFAPLSALDPVWSLVSVTSTYWFPAAATTGATILPELGYAELGTKALLGAGILFVAVKVDQGIDRVQEWKKNR